MAGNRNIRVDPVRLAEKVLSLRLDQGLTRNDLADRTGLSERTVRKVELGQQDRVQENTIVQLAKALGVGFRDLVEKDETAAIAPHVRGLNGRRGLALFALILVIGLATVAMLRRHAPSSALIDVGSRGSVLEGRENGTGRLLWRHVWRSEIKVCEPTPWKDGRTVVGFKLPGEDGGRLLVIDDATGATAWEMAADETPLLAAFGAEVMDQGKMFFHHLRVCDLEGDGEPEIVVTYFHSKLYPTAFRTFDHQGRALGQYNNRGQIYKTASVDLDGDGAEEFLGVGVNNSPRWHGPTVIALDAAHLSGSTDSHLQVEVREGARHRMVLPAFDRDVMAALKMERLGFTSLIVFETTAGEVGVQLNNPLDDLGNLIVQVDARLRPIDVQMEDRAAVTITRTWPQDLAGDDPRSQPWIQTWLDRAVCYDAGDPIGPFDPPSP